MVDDVDLQLVVGIESGREAVGGVGHGVRHAAAVGIAADLDAQLGDAVALVGNALQGRLDVVGIELGIELLEAALMCLEGRRVDVVPGVIIAIESLDAEAIAAVGDVLQALIDVERRVPRLGAEVALAVPRTVLAADVMVRGVEDPGVAVGIAVVAGVGDEEGGVGGRLRVGGDEAVEHLSARDDLPLGGLVGRVGQADVHEALAVVVAEIGALVGRLDGIASVGGAADEPGRGLLVDPCGAVDNLQSARRAIVVEAHADVEQIVADGLKAEQAGVLAADELRAPHGAGVEVDAGLAMAHDVVAADERPVGAGEGDVLPCHPVEVGVLDVDAEVETSVVADGE